MSNTKSLAEKEFEILEQKYSDAIVLEFKDEILNLVDKFGNIGQSGGSAPYYIDIISSAVKKLCSHETLSELTGEDDEWIDVSSYCNEEQKFIFQNKRDSSLFKDEDGCYYLNAIVFECKDDMGGTSFYSNNVIFDKNKILSSHQYIKKFPFYPRKFIIDVVKNGEDFFVKNENQLKDVFEYYDVKK